MLDFVSIVLFFSAVLFFLVDSTCADARAKTVLGINSVIIFYRFAYFYAINEFLGPKLIMVQLMLWDVAVFLAFLILIIAGFGVSKVAMTSESDPFTLSTFSDVFYT